MNDPYRANGGITPKLRVPFSALPPEYSALFHAGETSPFVARGSVEVVNAIIVLWITIPMVIAMSAGLLVGQKPDASLGIMLAVVAIFAFPSARTYLRERSRRKTMLVNPRWLGIAFGDAAMVIRMSENECSLLPYRHLQRVHIGGVGTKNETVVGDVDFILEDATSVRISHEESYDLESLLRHLAQRQESIVFTHDEALSERGRAVIPGAKARRSPNSPSVAREESQPSAGSAPTGRKATAIRMNVPTISSAEDAERYLRALFAERGVGVILAKPEYSNGQQWSPEEWSMSRPLEASLAELEPIAPYLGQGLGGTGTLVTEALLRGEPPDEMRAFTSVVMQHGPDFVCASK